MKARKEREREFHQIDAKQLGETPTPTPQVTRILRRSPSQ